MAIADVSLTGTVSAAGTATIRIKPTGRQQWTVSQVSVEAPNVGAASCALRKNGFMVSPLVATGDAAGGDPPVVLHPADVMTVEWTAATVGAQVRVLVIYDDGQG